MFHSLIVTNKSSIVRQKTIENIINSHKINALDILNLQSDSSLGIKDIKQAISFLNSRPFASKYKAVIINGDNLTQEAQQAMLKTLEEPPEYAQIIIHGSYLEQFLPTVISRCMVQEVIISDQPVTNNQEDDFLSSILHKKIGDRLLEVNNLTKDREEALRFLETEILSVREKMLTNYQNANSKQGHIYAQILRSLTEAHQQLKSNLNIKLTLDHMMLSIPYVDNKTLS